MAIQMKLGEVKIGQSATVQTIDSDGLRSKLLELGLTTGSRIQVLYFAPFGDPIAIDLEGFVLSLRKSEANLIHVTVQQD